MPGKLYIVATPIGNLEDITKRALDILSACDLILAEDTRVTKKLLLAYDIRTPVFSYHAHSRPEKMGAIKTMLEAGKKLALVTDAGTPGISDPGNELIAFLSQNYGSAFSEFLEGSGVHRTSQNSSSAEHINSEPQIIPIPGPSALTAAMSVCGFNMQEFTFIGFMPKKKRVKLVTSLIEQKRPFVYFDSPYRVLKNLELISGLAGGIRVFVARELTKLHEEHYRGPVEQVIASLREQKKVKGEVVVVVSPGRIELPSKV